MDCNNEIFEDFLSNCGDSIILNSSLVPGQTYKWQITDKFGKVYEGLADADPYGTSLEIDLTDPDTIPAGLINAYGGVYALRLFDTTDECKQISFKMTRYFKEVFFETRRGTAVKNTLGCEC